MKSSIPPDEALTQLTQDRASFTENDLVIVLAQEPELTSHGLGICWRRHRGPVETAFETYRARAELFDRVEVIAKVVEWLRPRPKLKNVTNRSHSYELKHECEREIGQYVTNGELIAAAIHLGFRYKSDNRSAWGINANTNIGKIKKPSRWLLEVA